MTAVRLLPLVLLVALGCQPSPPPDVESPPETLPGTAVDEAAAPQLPDGVLDEARSAADALGMQLQGRLLAALEEGGPTQAVEVCSVEAQEIARSLSGDGHLVRRVSLRTRNPANDPDGYEREILEEWEAVWGEEEVPGEFWEVAAREGRPTLRYLRPIPVAGPCTTCHGEPDQVAPEVMALIRRLYPEDRAVGYSAGDLRGAVSVSIPLDTPSDR